MATVASTMTRVNTVASALKRFFSREDSNKGPLTPDGETLNKKHSNKTILKFAYNFSATQQQIRLPGSSSTASLAPKMPPPGSLKITDQVIEEVDEQMTVTSMRQPEIRPTAQSLFQPPPPSEPVDVPNNRPNSDYSRTQSFIAKRHDPTFDEENARAFMSSSAPAARHLQTPPNTICGISIEDFDDSLPGSQSSVVTETPTNTTPTTANDPAIMAKFKLSSDEYYEKLQRERYNKRIGRSISTQHPGHNDTEHLLNAAGKRHVGLSASQENNTTSDTNL